MSYLSRDEKMGQLAETNRFNVMLTRAKYGEVVIIDENFYKNPKGRQSRAILHYAQIQAMNGAVALNLRNWSVICHRCCLPHRGDCRAKLVCFFCKGDHHARNCPEKGSLSADIQEDRLRLLTPEDEDAEDEDTKAQAENADAPATQNEETNPPAAELDENGVFTNALDAMAAAAEQEPAAAQEPEENEGVR